MNTQRKSSCDTALISAINPCTGYTQVYTYRGSWNSTAGKMGLKKGRPDDLQMLCDEVDKSRRRAILAGTLHFFKGWPGTERTDLLSAILVGCLISAAFVILALLPAILIFVPHSNASCHFLRTSLSRDNGRATNIYFLKHENRTWTDEELCHIETAAHRYPEYNVFTINLLAKDDWRGHRRWNAKFFDEILEQHVTSKLRDTNVLQNTNSSETELRYKLSRLPNVINIDVGVERFFAGSMMAKRVENRSKDEIELAAKFQVIWDLPGIALEPLIVHQLEAIQQAMNNSNVNTDANVQMENDLQATSVPCQSFIGLVISEIVQSDFADRQTVLKRALMDFCPNPTECNGVRIVKTISKGPSNFTSCPTVYPMMQ